MNILVVTKNWLGDVIFETPALRTIKENFPQAHLIAVTPNRCVEILQACPYVDEIIPFDDRKRKMGFIFRWGLIWSLRKRKIDKAYLFHQARKFAQIAFLSGIPERIGYQTKRRGHLLTHGFPEPEGPIHNVQYFLDLLRLKGLKVSGDYWYEFRYLPEDDARASSLLKECNFEPGNIVAINPGANWAPKRWPAESFRELAHCLMEKYGVQIVITGTEDDQPVARAILNSHNGTSLMASVCGKTSVRELGALFAKCRLVISNDTGPLQIGENFPAPWMECISVNDILRVIEKEKLLS